MIDFFKMLDRINSVPIIPRICFFCSIFFLVLFLLWSIASPSSTSSPLTTRIIKSTSQADSVSLLIFGTNLGLFNRDDQVLSSAPTRSLLQQIHTQIIRMPVRTNLSEATEVQAAQDIKNLGDVPDVDLLGPTDPNALTDDTRIVSDMNGIFGNGAIYYEYGNEDDLIGVSAEQYTASWNTVVPVLKELAPQAHFAGPVTYQYDQTYLTTFLKEAQPLPDEVSWHEYTCMATDTKDSCIAHIDDWSTHIASARATMTATIGKALPIMITEWNYAPDATPNDGKSNDSNFLSAWTLKALQTLAANHVFASMQYYCTGTVVPLVDSHNNLAVQGMAFQAVYEQVMTTPQHGAPTVADQSVSTATGTNDSAQILQPTATDTTDSTQSLQPTATDTTDSARSFQSTAMASPTATSASTTPTPTPQDLYKIITNTHPAYTTSLANQDGGQWEAGPFNGGGSCEFANGAYDISIPQQNMVGICDAEGISVVDFALQVQMKISSGDGGGVVFRDNGTNFYRFGISSNGSFNLANQAKVIASGSNAGIKKGLNQVNTLTVIAQGKQIDIYANGQLLVNVSDSASGSGKIGLFAVDFTNPTRVAFSNLKVWSL